MLILKGVDVVSVSSIIETIRKRPGMYLGSNSITALFHFLNGYVKAEKEHDVYWRREMFPLDFEYMSEFTNVRLNYSGNMGWCHHILVYCEGDEEKALNKFFELYDEFNQVRMKRYWKAILSEDNIQWNNSMENICTVRYDKGKGPAFFNPVAVYVIELTIPAYILVVETMDDIRFEVQFFRSAKEAKENGRIPSGAELYFGKIDLWEEVQASDIRFDKIIRRI